MSENLAEFYASIGVEKEHRETVQDAFEAFAADLKRAMMADPEIQYGLRHLDVHSSPEGVEIRVICTQTPETSSPEQ